MALSAFGEKTSPPSADDVRTVLGKSHKAWDRLIDEVSNRIAPISPVWGFTSAKSGWGLRLLRSGRVILYMTPCEGHFLVSFALGEKAVAAARDKGLAPFVLDAIDRAPRYAEGRGMRFEIRSVREIPPLVALAEIKNDH